MKKTNEYQKSYLTVTPNSGHRIGHKLDDLITGFILAEWYGLNYLHSPLPDKMWEDFFGFGEGETSFYKDFRKDLPIISCTPYLGVRYISPRFRFLFKHIEYLDYRIRYILKKIPVKKISEWREPDFWEGSPFSYFKEIFERNSEREVIFCFQRGKRVMLYQIYEWGQQGKVDSDLYLRVIEKLRTKYFSQEHPKKFSYFDTSVISVAVHIRRDDASVENQRFLPISYYKKLLSNLSKILADKPHEFHVYSSGLDREMEEIQKELNPVSSQLRYHPNESAMEAIHHMAIADILVVGNSSFSHWPGFLSSGIKLYHPHFHMFNLDENEWVEVKEDSSFNESHFISLLSSSQKGIDFSDTHAKLQAQ